MVVVQETIMAVAASAGEESEYYQNVAEERPMVSSGMEAFSIDRLLERCSGQRRYGTHAIKAGER